MHISHPFDVFIDILSIHISVCLSPTIIKQENIQLGLFFPFNLSGKLCFDLLKVSVIAIDPAQLDPEVKELANLRHLKLKAEDAVRGNPKGTWFHHNFSKNPDDMTI